ncbi:MAG: hypothetical protein JXA54_09090 [Candidatus Heimdallarchaeota archaeon]|nr:hypothetical protein [Candidatus Heimdallarchaeota archaeon]
MSKQDTDIAKLDKRYISALLNALETRKKNNQIDQELYSLLKEKYSIAYEAAQDKSSLFEGFTTFEAIAPNPETIYSSVKQLLQRFNDLEKEKNKIQERFSKLDDLFNEGSISESVLKSKKKEYEILLSKYEDQKRKYIEAIPSTLDIIKAINDGILERLEELEVEKTINGSKAALDEKAHLTKLKSDIAKAAKELSNVVELDFSADNWNKPTISTSKEDIISITPLKEQFKAPERTTIETESLQTPPPPPQDSKWVKWKNMVIGKLVGDVNMVGGSYAVIATDRPSLAIIRDFALTGPSRLRTSTNPKVIEERLGSMVKEAYNVEEGRALLPENLVKFAIDNKIGVDLFRLINSYYASVGIGAITVQGKEAIINDNAQVLTLAENVNLLGRRVLAPDRSLIGVIHELYYDPITSHLYAFAFKGVPPPVIRKIYQDSHNRAMTDNTFGEFRNEIAKQLSVPIYEALTPSSVVRYSLMSGLIKNINQLVTLVESMNPRITKTVDISSISSQGVLLTRFPSNALPRIEYFEY